MNKLTENVYAIQTMFNFMNTYVIANGDKLVLIDTGTDANYITTLEKHLKAQGWSLDNVAHILITHAHYDHVGGLKALQDRANAPTYAHRLDAPIIRGEQPNAWPKPGEIGFLNRMMLRMASSSTFTPARVDVDLDDGQTLDAVYPGLQVVHLPGHTYGQVGYWLPESRCLLGGDVMMRLPWGFSVPFRAASPDWTAVKNSIRKVADLNADIIGLGHGPPKIGGAAQKIRAFADRVS